MNTTNSAGVLDGIRFDSDAGDGLTIRQYFHALLRKLWIEGDGFSGKRPFGYSGWEYDLYAPLIKAGIVRGQLDDDGYIEDVDSEQANEIVLSLIDAALAGNGKEGGK